MRRSSRTSSMKSLKTGRETASGRAMFYDLELDFEKELQDACRNFNCCGIVVNKGLQNDEFYKTLKDTQKKGITKRLSLAAGTHVAPAEEVKTVPDDALGKSVSSEDLQSSSGPTLAVVEALYDSQDELAELVISEVSDFPRKLMQCIALLIPYFRYLNKMSIVKSRINVYTLHELNKILLMSNLTDVCLDGSYFPEANYAILLDQKTKLRHLSLSRCRINDEVCKLIASKLDFRAPAGETLVLLNLSCNHIADAGAKCLAQALRTNRCLRYLNLADNRITDSGALQLFDVLTEFPLMYDDIVQKRKRYTDYLKRKKAIYLKFVEDCESKSPEELSHKSNTPRKTKSGIGPKKSRKECVVDVDIATRAELMSLELLGLFIDPFGQEFTIIKGGVTYCTGNIVLCYLNLAYNCLSYLSIDRLHAVLLYQSRVKKPADYGLIKVVLNGNPLPVYCEQYEGIDQAITNSIFRHTGPDTRRKASILLKKKP